uniref:Uncharacterized protein n=1 Tax=Anguilla anguilla TaxID=7936 RepID=A0A0E9W9X0_ANGAN
MSAQRRGWVRRTVFDKRLSKQPLALGVCATQKKQSKLFLMKKPEIW